MKRILDFIKKWDWVFITFGISTIIVSIIYYLKSIAPFGVNSMLDIDFYHQYGPMLSEMYDRIKNGQSLIYSFSTALGLPFYRNFMNYLSSPFKATYLASLGFQLEALTETTSLAE